MLTVHCYQKEFLLYYRAREQENGYKYLAAILRRSDVGLRLKVHKHNKKLKHRGEATLSADWDPNATAQPSLGRKRSVTAVTDSSLAVQPNCKAARVDSGLESSNQMARPPSLTATADHQKAGHTSYDVMPLPGLNRSGYPHSHRAWESGVGSSRLVSPSKEIAGPSNYTTYPPPHIADPAHQQASHAIYDGRPLSGSAQPVEQTYSTPGKYVNNKSTLPVIDHSNDKISHHHSEEPLEAAWSRFRIDSRRSINSECDCFSTWPRVGSSQVPIVNHHDSEGQCEEYQHARNAIA